MDKIPSRHVQCELCKGRYKRITNTHLWMSHRLTMAEYQEQFPNSPIDAPGLAHSRVAHLRNRSYVEVYGEEKAAEMKTCRKDSATAQMTNPEQIEVRKEKCGYEQTEEQKAAISKAMTIHGGSNYRERALKYYGLECRRCGFTSTKKRDFCVHHKDCLNVLSELANHDLDNLLVVCKPCHAKLHNEIGKATGRFVGISSIEKGVHLILRGLKLEYGLDLLDENFKDTPKRVSRAYAEIFSGIRNTKEQVVEILSSAFPSEYSELVIVRDIRVFSMCPHHLLPVDYTIQVAYIPGENGQVLGLSKLARLVEVLAGRPVLQEQLSEDITKSLMLLDGTVGAACLVEGKHYCMIMRGIRQVNSSTITSSLKGVFMRQDSFGLAAREELMRLIRG